MIHPTIISNPLSFFPAIPRSQCEDEIICSNLANFPCHHCPKRLCLKHLTEHNTSNIIRADELTNEITRLTDSLVNAHPQQSFDKARHKLDTWKRQTLDHIENMYQFRSNEIDRFETELNDRLHSFKETVKSQMSTLQTQLSLLQTIGEISQQQLLPIECDLKQLRHSLDSVRCELQFEIKSISFDDLFQIQNIFSYNRTSLHTIQTQSYRTISLENMNKFTCSKTDDSILWLDTQRQLHCIDQNFKTHRLTMPKAISSDQQTKLSDVNIVDIKWCSSAQVFLLLFPHCLLSFDHKTNQFIDIPITRHRDYPFHCISSFDDSSFYISYCTPGIHIELWNYSYDNRNAIHSTKCMKRWDCLSNDQTEWLSHMNTNIASQVGLLIRKGSSIYRRFELRDKYLKLLKQISLNEDYIDGFFPFRHNYWFMKSLAEKYYIYCTETDTYIPSAFDFPFGLQEFGMNSIVIGNTQGELILCDIK